MSSLASSSKRRSPTSSGVPDEVATDSRSISALAALSGIGWWLGIGRMESMDA